MRGSSRNPSGSRGLRGRFKQDDWVALLAPDTPEWVIIQQAASFADLVLVPINAAYAAREVEFVLKSWEAAGIITPKPRAPKTCAPSSTRCGRACRCCGPTSTRW